MRYPDFHGDEPCTQLGPDLYEAPVKTEGMLMVLRAACDSCWIMEACREWALNHEAMSTAVWGGLTHEERQQVRKRRRIRTLDPLLMVETRASA